MKRPALNEPDLAALLMDGNADIEPRLARGRRRLQLLLLILFLASGCAGLKQCAYEGVSRDEWQQPEKVIRSLRVGPGNAVADLGAGSGYFTFRLAEAVGSAGKVYAVDIDPDMTELLGQKAKDRDAANVEVVLAQPEDPLLPDGGIDLIFTSNTYHHIENRVRYFSNLRRALRPGGRVAVVEYDRRSWAAGWFSHATPPETIKREMAAAGYRLVQDWDFLDRQSFLVFELARVDSTRKIQRRTFAMDAEPDARTRPRGPWRGATNYRSSGTS